MTLVSLNRNGPWYRAAPAAVANAGHVPSAMAVNRFNDGNGTSRLLYFAPNPVTALLEARALLGFPLGPLAPAGIHRHWTVFRYTVTLARNAIVDFGDPKQRSAFDTTIQEMTGDWEGYALRRTSNSPTSAVRVGRLTAPTQELAARLQSDLSLQGFLAPSARNPIDANLVLLYDRLAQGSVVATGRQVLRL